MNWMNWKDRVAATAAVLLVAINLAVLTHVGPELSGSEPRTSLDLTRLLRPELPRLTGWLTVRAVRPDGTLIAERRGRNLIPNAAETALRDCFGGTGTPTCTAIQAMKYHGIGTSAVAAAETDTGCTTELTTEYNPNNTRATGSQTNNGANIYRTVGTNTVDATVAITEFCLMSQAATGGGTIWSRVVFSTINLSSGDSLQTTYDLTIE